MGQWGQRKSFLNNGYAFVVIPHFDTGAAFAPIQSGAKLNAIVIAHASGPGAIEIKEKLEARCMGMTVREWDGFESSAE